jgi:hypothetical protein
VAKHTIPTYAIVELLIRLSHINPLIGDYKGHAVYNDGVMVKTSSGTIPFTKKLIDQQFNHPESITDAQLLDIARLFIPANKSR